MLYIKSRVVYLKIDKMGIFINLNMKQTFKKTLSSNQTFKKDMPGKKNLEYTICQTQALKIYHRASSCLLKHGLTYSHPYA